MGKRLFTIIDKIDTSQNINEFNDEYNYMENDLDKPDTYKEVQLKIQEYNNFKWSNFSVPQKTQYSNQSPEMILKKIWGFDSFRPLQKEIIDTVISGKNVFVMLSTSSGKSITFQIPALIRDGITIVISPILALIEDQYYTLKKLGIPVAKITNNLSSEQKRKIYNGILQQEFKIILVSPERILTPNFQEIINQIPLNLIVFDEAHCLYQWGQSFRRSYLYAATLLRKIPVPKMALTATIREDGMEKIKQILDMNSCYDFIGNKDRKNLTYNILKLNNKENVLSELLKYIDKNKGNNIIIYRNNKKDVHEIYDLLVNHGYKTLMYHADMSSRDKMLNMDIFKTQESLIMVSTIAFGMGIDKKNIRNVINIGASSSLESYTQEVGRAGRDGLPADVLMLYDDNDLKKQFRNLLITQGDTHSFEENALMYNNLIEMRSYMESPLCRRKLLMTFYGEKYTHDCNNCDICLSKANKIYYEKLLKKSEYYIQIICETLDYINKQNKEPSLSLLINIIIGKENIRIKENSLSNNIYFGKGVNVSYEKWENICYQLISYNYITIVSKGCLRLTIHGKNWLKEPKSLDLFDYNYQNKNIDTIKLLNTNQINLKLELINWVKHVNKTEINFCLNDGEIDILINNPPQSIYDIQKTKIINDEILFKYSDSLLSILKKYPNISLRPKPTLNNIFNKKK